MSEKNKLLSLFLCLLLVFSTFSSTEISYLGAVADEETNELPAIYYSDDSIYSDDLTDDNTYYIGDFCVSVLEDETLQIEGFSEWYETPSDLDSFSLEIPSLLADRAVTSIGYGAFEDGDFRSVTIPDSVTSIGGHAFSWCESLTSVTIPDTVTSIGNSAFSGCESLTSITIPDSVTSIGDWAFADCTSLTSVTIPDSVTSIGDGAFSDCESLTSINVDENNENYCDINGILFNKDKTELIQYPIGKTDTSYTIPDSVISIGDRAFSNCKSLRSITIGNSVTSIGGYAFYWCTSLTSVTIPDGVTEIDIGVFEWCTSLTSVIIPDSVTKIYYSAFQYCESLTSITIPDSVISIYNGAFNDTGYYNNKDNWEDNVLYIGNYLIEADTSISGDYTIKDDTKLIATEAFYDCTSLTSITIPNSVTSIGSSAFEDCTSLTSVTIPDSVTSIGSRAFGYIWDEEYVVKDGFTINGYTNSEAERYAINSGITFVSLGEAPIDPTDPTQPTTPTQSTAKPTVTTSNQTPIGPNKPANTNVTTSTVKTTTKAVANSFKAPKVKAKASKGKISLTLKKVKGTAGYQVRYKVNGKWKVKTFKIKKNATKVIKKLKKGKYKVQIRLINNSKKALSNWSKAKTVKVK